MNDEEYEALKEQGWVGITHRDVADAIDPWPTRQQKDRALAQLFGDFGLDITKPIRLAFHFDSRSYALIHREDGQLIRLEDLKYQ